MKKTLKKNNNKKIKKESLKIIKNKQKKTQKNKIKGGSIFKKMSDSASRARKSLSAVARTSIKTVIKAPSNAARMLDMNAFYNYLPANNEVEDSKFKLPTSKRMTKNLYVNLKSNLMALACIDHLTFLEMMFNNPHDISDYVNLNSHMLNNSWYAPNVLNYKNVVNIQNEKLGMEDREKKRNNIITMFKEKFNERFKKSKPLNRTINEENKNYLSFSGITTKFIDNFNKNIDKVQQFGAEVKDKSAKEGPKLEETLEQTPVVGDGA